MSELRKDPATDTWVIIDTERATRVRLVQPSIPSRRKFDCPFCPGNEKRTPPEIRVYGPSAGQTPAANWGVRVVPDRNPILRVEGELVREGESGIYDRISATGAHEVVIAHPDHLLGIADMYVDHLDLVFQAVVERINDLRRDIRLRYIMFHINKGKKAGATQDHPHLHVTAVPVTPKRVKEKYAGGRAYYEYKDRCVYCDLIQQEVQGRERVVAETDHMLAVAPFASRFPFEIWILPKRHASDFGAIGDGERRDFARLFRECLRRLRSALADSDWNALLCTGPNLAAARPGRFRTITHDFHWHVEIIPRIATIAGFEWGTGFYINPVTPEEAAGFLRTCDPDEVGIQCFAG